MSKYILCLSTILVLTLLFALACGQAAPPQNEQVLSETPQNQNLQPPIPQAGAQPTSAVDAGGVTPETAQESATSVQPTVPASPSGPASVTPESMPPTSVPVTDEAQPTQVAGAPTTEPESPTTEPEPEPASPAATKAPEPTPVPAKPRTHREILTALYRSTNGEAWANNENWLTDQPLEEWYGVTTNDRGGVLDLDLAGNGLTGTLPKEIWLMGTMEALYLEDNGLTGELPTLDIATMKIDHIYLQLSDINISGNQLTGCVPVFLTETFGANYAGYGSLDPCPYPDREPLEDLYNATGGPNWTNQENWMTDAPLSQWAGVTADQNGNVIGLNLRHNNMEGLIPASIANMEHMESLSLGNNPSGEFAKAVREGRDTLPVLIAQKANRIVGPLPEELFTLKALKRFELERTGLTGQFPIGFTRMENLETLDLGYNSLEGPIPAELGRLNTLRRLSLYNNQLQGTIPPELGGMEQLVQLGLSGNNLSGTIPSELGNLPALTNDDKNHLILISTLWGTGLGLADNQLTGEIPPSLGNLIGLGYLGLNDNQLTGEIPPSLGNLIQLRYLDLRANQLTGRIPKELAEMKSLQDLSLADNMLTGRLPEVLAEIESLESLDVRNNQLSGTIPESLKRSRYLNLWTEGNNFRD